MGAIEVIMKLISSQSMLAEIWGLEIEIWKMYSFSNLFYPEPLCRGLDEKACTVVYVGNKT
jgi:hypothetical protein